MPRCWLGLADGPKWHGYSHYREWPGRTALQD